MTVPSETFPFRYRSDIDGLRAVAVVSVVAFHVFPSRFTGGFVGVDIFFVISGYLITGTVLTGLGTGRFSFSEFYARRVRRIFPALMVVLSACLAAGWWLLLADEYAQLAKYVVAGALSVANLVLTQERGYFDGDAKSNPLLHLWSLGVEEQFYLIWPLIIWWLRGRRADLTAALAVVAAASLLLSLQETVRDPIASFYSPLTRLWELSAGGVLACLAVQGKIPSAQGGRLASGVLAGAGLSLIVCSVLYLTETDPFPGWRALFPVSGTLLVIAAGSGNPIASYVLSHRVAVWFGLVSYPLYLWHWPLLSFAYLIEGSNPAGFIRVAFILLSVFLAWLTYKFIELPVRSASGISYVRPLSVSAIAVAVIGMHILLGDGFSLRGASVESGLTGKARDQFVGSLWRFSSNDKCLNKYPRGDHGGGRWWFCMKSSDKPPTIILLGTSFANQLYPGFVANPAFRGHSILSIGTCDFAGVETRLLQVDHPCFGRRITAQRDFIDRLVETNPSIRFAIIDGLERNPDAAYIARLRERITRYESMGVRMILFTPHIKPGFHPKTCFSRPLRPAVRDCTFPMVIRQGLYENFQPVITSLGRTNPRVRFFEQNEMFCQGMRCSFLSGGIPLHRDEGHLSEFGSVKLQKYFTEWAATEIPEILQPRDDLQLDRR